MQNEGRRKKVWWHKGDQADHAGKTARPGTPRVGRRGGVVKPRPQKRRTR